MLIFLCYRNRFNSTNSKLRSELLLFTKYDWLVLSANYLSWTGGDAEASFLHLELALDVLADVAPEAVENSISMLYESSIDCVIETLSYGDTAGRPPRAPGAKLEDPEADDDTVARLLTPIWSKWIIKNLRLYLDWNAKWLHVPNFIGMCVVFFVSDNYI